jgi:hypothetical protein
MLLQSAGQPVAPHQHPQRLRHRQRAPGAPVRQLGHLLRGGRALLAVAVALLPGDACAAALCSTCQVSKALGQQGPGEEGEEGQEACSSSGCVPE